MKNRHAATNLIAAFLIFYCSAYAAENRKFTATLTTTGATASFAYDETFGGEASTIHTVQVIVAGSPSGCAVRLEGSLDGTNWFDLSGSQTCTSSVMFHVADKPVSWVRINLVTWTGGTAAVVTYKGSN